MEWLCQVINHSNTANSSLSESSVNNASGGGYHSGYANSNYNAQEDITISDTPRPEETFEFVVTKLITPSLCIFGLVGNFLNLLILFKRVGKILAVLSFSI